MLLFIFSGQHVAASLSQRSAHVTEKKKIIVFVKKKEPASKMSTMSQYYTVTDADGHAVSTTTMESSKTVQVSVPQYSKLYLTVPSLLPFLVS